MKTRKLGASQLEVSAIGLGCMGMTHSFGVVADTKEMVQLMHDAVDRGVTLFDTAEIYGPYNNEELVGKGIAGMRDKIVLATKCGVYMRNGKQEVDNDPALLRQSLEGSLKRLGTDHIDLYYLHRYAAVVPIEEIAELMLQFKKEGKILNWGLSEAGIQTIRRAHAVFPLTAVESEYSMMWREPEKELLSVLEELNIGFVPFAPLCKGFLTGTLPSDTKFGPGDSRANSPRFQPENMAANQPVVEYIRSVASDFGVKPTQIALAWLLNQKPFIVPIPGTKKLSRLEENIAAADIVFTPEQLRQINETLAKFEIHGHRYNAAYAARAGK